MKKLIVMLLSVAALGGCQKKELKQDNKQEKICKTFVKKMETCTEAFVDLFYMQALKDADSMYMRDRLVRLGEHYKSIARTSFKKQVLTRVNDKVFMMSCIKKLKSREGLSVADKAMSNNIEKCTKKKTCKEFAECFIGKYLEKKKKDESF